MSSKAAERRAVHGTGKQYWRRLGSEVKRDRWLYLLLLPGLIGHSGVFWAEVLAWLGADMILIPSYLRMYGRLSRAARAPEEGFR